MTTAFQPNAFQVNPLAFQISQIGSARSGVMREWLMAEQAKALEADEKKVEELKAKLREEPQPRPRRPRLEPLVPLEVYRPFQPLRLRLPQVLPTIAPLLEDVLELPRPSPAMLRAQPASAEIVDLSAVTAQVKKRRARQRRKAALLMLLAA